MPNFSIKSHDKLNTLDPQLQKLLIKAIPHIDFTILEGHRTLERQEQLFKEGKSKTMNSKHLPSPSLAVDIAPYPIDWNDTERFAHLIGIIKGIAICENIRIRCGMDFKTLHDYPHIELV